MKSAEAKSRFYLTMLTLFDNVTKYNLCQSWGQRDGHLAKNEFHNVLCKEQIGFIKGKRTTDHMFILKNLVDRHTHKGASPLYFFC